MRLPETQSHSKQEHVGYNNFMDPNNREGSAPKPSVTPNPAIDDLAKEGIDVVVGSAKSDENEFSISQAESRSTLVTEKKTNAEVQTQITASGTKETLAQIRTDRPVTEPAASIKPSVPPQFSTPLSKPVTPPQFAPAPKPNPIQAQKPPSPNPFTTPPAPETPSPKLTVPPQFATPASTSPKAAAPSAPVEMPKRQSFGVAPAMPKIPDAALSQVKPNTPPIIAAPSKPNAPEPSSSVSKPVTPLSSNSSLTSQAPKPPAPNPFTAPAAVSAPIKPSVPPQFSTPLSKPVTPPLSDTPRPPSTPVYPQPAPRPVPSQFTTPAPKQEPPVTQAQSPFSSPKPPSPFDKPSQPTSPFSTPKQSVPSPTPDPSAYKPEESRPIPPFQSLAISSERSNQAIKNDPSIKPLRTFRSDAEEAVRYQNVSAIDIAVAEQKKKEEKPAPVEYQDVKKSHGGALALSAIGLVIVLGAGWYLWFSQTSPQSEIPITQTAEQKVQEITVETLIPYQNGSTLALSTGSDTLALIGAKLGAANAGLGDVYVIVPTIGATSTSIAPITEIFSGTNAPDRLLRSLGNDYMIGMYRYEKQGSFVLLTNTFFQNAFAGMLEWEKDMRNDLISLIQVTHPEESVISTDSDIFEDAIVSNIDTRVLKGKDGNVILAYAFSDKDTAVIASSIETLKYVLDRLLTVRTIQ
jgi:hypothetical protein